MLTRRVTVNGIDRSLTDFLAYLEALDTVNDPIEDVIKNLDQAMGFYRFSWLDMSLDTAKQLNIGSSTSSILFTAAFKIESGAVMGTSYDITLGTNPNPSKLVDINLEEATYLSASPAMRVTVRSVTPPTPAPEPGMLGLLFVDIAAYGCGAVRLRRQGRG